MSVTPSSTINIFNISSVSSRAILTVLDLFALTVVIRFVALANSGLLTPSLLSCRREGPPVKQEVQENPKTWSPQHPWWIGDAYWGPYLVTLTQTPTLDEVDRNADFQVPMTPSEIRLALHTTNAAERLVRGRAGPRPGRGTTGSTGGTSEDERDDTSTTAKKSTTVLEQRKHNPPIPVVMGVRSPSFLARLRSDPEWDQMHRLGFSIDPVVQGSRVAEDVLRYSLEKLLDLDAEGKPLPMVASLRFRDHTSGAGSAGRSNNKSLDIFSDGFGYLGFAERYRASYQRGPSGASETNISSTNATTNSPVSVVDTRESTAPLFLWIVANYDELERDMLKEKNTEQDKKLSRPLVFVHDHWTSWHDCIPYRQQNCVEINQFPRGGRVLPERMDYYLAFWEVEMNKEKGKRRNRVSPAVHVNFAFADGWGRRGRRGGDEKIEMTGGASSRHLGAVDVPAGIGPPPPVEPLGGLMGNEIHYPPWDHHGNDPPWDHRWGATGPPQNSAGENASVVPGREAFHRAWTWMKGVQKVAENGSKSSIPAIAPRAKVVPPVPVSSPPPPAQRPVTSNPSQVDSSKKKIAEVPRPLWVKFFHAQSFWEFPHAYQWRSPVTGRPASLGETFWNGTLLFDFFGDFPGCLGAPPDLLDQNPRARLAKAEKAITMKGCCGQFVVETRGILRLPKKFWQSVLWWIVAYTETGGDAVFNGAWSTWWTSRMMELAWDTVLTCPLVGPAAAAWRREVVGDHVE